MLGEYGREVVAKYLGFAIETAYARQLKALEKAKEVKVERVEEFEKQEKEDELNEEERLRRLNNGNLPVEVCRQHSKD